MQTILTKRLAGYIKSKHENILYKNWNNSQINKARCKSVNTIIGSKIWDIAEVVKFLKQGQKAWHYWLQNKRKIVLKEPK